MSLSNETPWEGKERTGYRHGGIVTVTVSVSVTMMVVVVVAQGYLRLITYYIPRHGGTTCHGMGQHGIA